MAFTRKPWLSLYSYVDHSITYKQDGAVSGAEGVVVGIFYEFISDLGCYRTIQLLASNVCLFIKLEYAFLLCSLWKTV